MTGQTWTVERSAEGGRREHMGRGTSSAALALFWLLCGCTQPMDSNGFTSTPTPTSGVGGSPPTTPPPPPVGIAGATGAGGAFTIPSPPEIIDDREPVLAEHVPPPVSGGTLLALSDGVRVVVADPDRDRLVVANYVGMYLDAILELETGDEPGRLIEGDGRVYVALRGSGQVATLDLETLSVTEVRPACQMPRGIALSPARDSIFVACAEGLLVELPLSGGEAVSEAPVDMDVRDIFFIGEQMVVSRFRSAELLELGAEREVLTRRRVPMLAETLRVADGVTSFENQAALFESSLAWRATTSADGTIVVAHQRATPDPIQLHRRHDGEDDPDEPMDPGPSEPGGSPYGSSFGCGGIVHSGVTSFHPDGTITTSPQLANVVLPVDVAVSKAGLVALANAGMQDTTGPQSILTFFGSVALLTQFELDRSQSGECVMPQAFSIGFEPAIAVAFDPVNDLLLAQAREPSQLMIADISTGQVRALALAGESVRHTGHEIFHRDTGTGIACASCHAEGSEDGRVWNFDPLGPRRTQPLDVELRDSAPFHWDGDMDDLDMLMSEVFVNRMGGVRHSPERIEALAEWIFELTPRPPVRAADDPAVESGKALFESKDAGCATCHSGRRFSNNLFADVGTGGPMQVPSLLGVAHRPPFLHTGCATTLLERFDPECGGDGHGDVSGLSDEDQLDLIAYLESL